jgi:hypothetical protein
VEGTPTDLGNCLDGLVCSFVCQPVFYIMKWCSVITVPGLVVIIFSFLLMTVIDLISHLFVLRSKCSQYDLSLSSNLENKNGK